MLLVCMLPLPMILTAFQRYPLESRQDHWLPLGWRGRGGAARDAGRTREAWAGRPVTPRGGPARDVGPARDARLGRAAGAPTRPGQLSAGRDRVAAVLPGPASGAPQMTDSQSPQLRPTPLTAVHERLGAKLTGFAGWLMPLRYRSETAEHQAVRTAAGIFDLSHMGEIMVTGPDAAAALDYALVGQPSALAPGRARYTMICAPDGGVIDDLIVYRLAEAEFLVVANAANTAAVLAELAERAADRGADRGADVTDRTDDYALIAVQGPRAAVHSQAAHQRGSQPGSLLRQLSRDRRRPSGPAGPHRIHRRGRLRVVHPPRRRRGHLGRGDQRGRGSDGLVPAGLAARDTLRLEAAMPLYGNELGPDVTPFDAGLGRVVKLDKPGDFVGRAALARRAAAAPERVLVGLTGRSRRIPRHGYGVPARWQSVRHGNQRRAIPDPGQADRHGLHQAGRRERGPNRRRRVAGSPSTSGAAPSQPTWWSCRSTAGRPDRAAAGLLWCTICLVHNRSRTEGCYDRSR